VGLKLIPNSGYLKKVLHKIREVIVSYDIVYTLGNSIKQTMPGVITSGTVAELLNEFSQYFCNMQANNALNEHKHEPQIKSMKVIESGQFAKIARFVKS
jgi:hypothetical protein